MKTKKIYFYRHQFAGILYHLPFSGKPSDEDLELMRALMLARHGAKHPKTGQTFWDAVVSVELHEPGSLKLALEEAGVKTPNLAAASEFHVSGTGEVKNP